MLINQNQISLIKENKVCFVKNFVSLERKYDFNIISDLLEENHLIVEQKTLVGNLKDVFQIHKVSNTLKEFKTFFDFLRKIFKYETHQKDEVDLFFSLTSQVGDTHFDEEDVFILGLSGQIIYRIYDKTNDDYHINKGDMIFIPKNIKHKVIGLTPRMVASFGFHGKKFIK